MQEALECAIQISDALEKAHRAGIVHRDLKPSNIMVTDDGIVKILDFGLAKLTHLGQEQSAEVRSSESLTRSGVILGTAAYMSPEQAEGKAVDARSDLFSFGAVLYEMVSGRRAFRGDSNLSALAAVLHDEPERISTIAGGMPPELERIINKALEKKCDLRYQHASDLCTDLKRLKRDTESGRAAVAAAATEVPGKKMEVKPLLQWRRILALTAALAVLLLVAASIWRWVPGFPGRSPFSGLPRMLAVVEIENLTQDSTIEWLNQGVAEMLTTNLAQAKGLDVISTQRIRELVSRHTREGGKLRSGEAQQVAREARADLLLSGALLKVGPRLRLDLRVQETDTGKVLYASKVEGEDAKAVFGMVDQTTAGILGRLVPGGESIQPNVAASLTSNLEALRAYEEGRSYYDGFEGPKAVKSFRQAIALDPQFAMAHYYLASIIYWMDIPGARRAINDAARLSERLPRQQKLLIQASQLRLNGHLPEAEKIARTAVREFPLEIEPRLELVWILADDARPKEAKSVDEEILRLDDKSVLPHVLIAIQFALEGDLANALTFLQRYATFLPPNHSNVLESRGDLLVLCERYEEAVAAYRKVLELNPAGVGLAEFWVCIDKVALAYLFQGNYSQAESTARSTYKRSIGAERARSAEILGDIEAGRGRLDRAVSWYEEAEQIYSSQEALTERPLMLKAARIHFEQQQPGAALALGRRHSSYWAAGIRGMAYLLLKDSAAAEKEFSQMHNLAAPLCGDYLANQIVEFHRLLAAFYGKHFQGVIAGWPQVRGPLKSLGCLEAGRSYLETGQLSEAEDNLCGAITCQRVWFNINNPEDFLSYMLGKFYLGKLHEQIGKRAEAISAYREFLSHFENSTAKLPQIDEARGSLNRLSQD